MNNNEGETQVSSNQVSMNSSENLSIGPTITLEVSSSVEDLDYLKNLVTKLPPKTASKPNKLANKAGHAT